MTDPRFSIIPAGAVLDRRLEPRDLQVLCLFGKHTDKKGWCRRSQVVMAKEIGCARSTVQASIDRLLAAGWLQKRAANELHTPGVRDSAHEYRVVLDVADDPQDVVSTPADQSAPLPTQDRHPLPTHGSAPMLTTPINDHPSLRSDGEPARASFDDVWEVFPKRHLTNRAEAAVAFEALSPAEQDRCFIAARRFARWHIEDSEARGVEASTQLEFRPGLGKWIRTGAWIEALSVPLRSDPIATNSDALVVVPEGHPDFEAVAKLRGKRPFVGKSGCCTFTKAEVEQARAA